MIVTEITKTKESFPIENSSSIDLIKLVEAKFLKKSQEFVLGTERHETTLSTTMTRLSSSMNLFIGDNKMNLVR